jgi:hypothetical protein
MAEKEPLESISIDVDENGLRKEPQTIDEMDPTPHEVEAVKLLESEDGSIVILEIWSNKDYDVSKDKPTVRIQLDRDLAIGLAHSILELDQNG